MTLIKVKHPIFAPGESTQVTGEAAAVQGTPGQGWSPTDSDGEQIPTPRPVLPQPALPPPPPRCRPLIGAARGRPRPARPRRGARSPAALCCWQPPGSPQCPQGVPTAMGTLRGSDVSPGSGGFSLCQMWGYHPAALLSTLCLGFFQLWALAAPSVTASLCHPLWVTCRAPFSAPLGQGSLQTPNLQHPGPEGKLALGKGRPSRFAKEKPRLHGPSPTAAQGGGFLLAGTQEGDSGRGQ